MADFNLKEALLLAGFSAKQHFQGYQNTAELVDTVKDMFSDIFVVVEDIQGRPDNFEAVLRTKIRSENRILEKFMKNTQVTVKKSVVK